MLLIQNGLVLEIIGPLASLPLLFFGRTQGLVHTQQVFYTELNASPASSLLLKEYI